MRSREAFSPFGDFFFSALAHSHQERLLQAVDQADTESALDAGLADAAARLAAQFAIAALVIDVENASRSERAETATAERFDIYSGRNAGDSYTRHIVTIHVPFTGDPDLFRCQASTRTVCSRPVWLAGTEVCFDIRVPTHGPVDIKVEVQRMLSCLKQNATSLAQEIAQFNQSLFASATSLLNRKRAEAGARAGVLDTLGVPARKKSGATSATISAPTERTGATAVGPQIGIDIFTHTFRVAFSFPGEARHRIGPIARNVREALGPHSVFYDEWYKAELARPNLDLRLQGVYTRAELVVVCLCAGYERKEWCGLEWRPIRDLIKKRQDRIMLLRLDDADVAGSFSIDGYIDLRVHDDTETGALVVRRVT
jgi:TIR domain